jgi:hypothetical protein
MISKKEFLKLKKDLQSRGVKLVVVSKKRKIDDIQKLYKWGQREFAENRAKSLVERYKKLPKDISWHMIGHLQRNKVKYIIDFVDTIQSVDSIRLMKEINKRAQDNVNILLQTKIAEEESKYGFEMDEIKEVLESKKLSGFSNLNFKGMMGMASFVNDDKKIKKEFSRLHKIFEKYKDQYDLDFLSMGMSSDYNIAIQAGSNMVRIGSKIFE